MRATHQPPLPPFIPLIAQSAPLPGPINFDLFMKDDKVVPIVGTKIGQERDLQDLDMSYEKAMKKAT